MGGKYNKKGKDVMKITRGTHTKMLPNGKKVTMVHLARAAGVQPCTIQQNVNILMKLVLPQMR